MELLLARPRGFCAGVDMAITALKRALELYGPPVYCYHQIVHNRFVVDEFERQHVVFVNDLEDVPPGSTTVFSAQGVAPAIRAQAAARSLRVIDTTCPLVSKVHSEARHFERRGYTIILIGHRGHDETVGVMGEVRSILLVETPEDAERVTVPDADRVAYLTQTTLSLADTARIVSVLKRRFPAICGPAQQDICYATQNRQEAVRALAGNAQVALVIGSRNSSNSLRLVEVAQSCGARAYLIDGPNEIDATWLAGVNRLMLTAGASVPESLVQATIDWLRARFRIELHEHDLVLETMRFLLPVELRRAARSG